MNTPNVLWIQTDEQRPDSLGCYGSAWAKTPNDAALAQRGIVFKNCACNSPVCIPSRASPKHSTMCVVTRDQRYRMDVTWWQDGQRLPLAEADGNLFNLDEDPRETRNLWSVPAMQPVVNDLWNKLEKWSQSIHTPAELFA